MAKHGKRGGLQKSWRVVRGANGQTFARRYATRHGSNAKGKTPAQMKAAAKAKTAEKVRKLRERRKAVHRTAKQRERLEAKRFLKRSTAVEKRGEARIAKAAANPRRAPLVKMMRAQLRAKLTKLRLDYAQRVVALRTKASRKVREYDARVAELRLDLRARLASFKTAKGAAPRAPRAPRPDALAKQSPTGAVGVAAGLRATRVDTLARIYHGHVAPRIERLAPRLVANALPLHAVRVVPEWKAGVAGTYSPDTRKVRINADTAYPHVTLAHELAHHLDYTALGARVRGPNGLVTGTESEHQPPHLRTLMRRIENSVEVMRLQHAADRGEDAHTQKPLGEVQVRHARYAVEPAELFARAFAQWVAARSDSAIMRLEMDSMRQRGSGYSHLQWSDESFHPIAREFDRVAREHWGAT